MSFRMHSIEDYDKLIAQIQREIDENPDYRFRIILKSIKSIDCPYLRRKLRQKFQY